MVIIMPIASAKRECIVAGKSAICREKFLQPCAKVIHVGKRLTGSCLVKTKLCTTEYPSKNY
jgi:hypothetical protein